MSEQVESRVYGDGEIIFREDEEGKELFFIQSGVIRIYKEEEGTVIELAVLQPGDLFGEMAVIDGSCRSANAMAMGDVRLLAMSESAFLEQMSRDPQIALRIMRKLARRLRTMTEQVEGLVSKISIYG